MFFVLACATPADDFEAYDPAAPLPEAATHEAAPAPEAELGLRGAPAWRAPTRGVVVGFTAPVRGRWVYPGAEVGMESGVAACKALGASRVCTAAELMDASESGLTASVPPGTRVWVQPEVDAANCMNFTYEGGHLLWFGSDARFEAAGDGVAFAIDYAPAGKQDPACFRDLAACDAVTPHGFECNAERVIACCG